MKIHSKNNNFFAFGKRNFFHLLPRGQTFEIAARIMTPEESEGGMRVLAIIGVPGDGHHRLMRRTLFLSLSPFDHFCQVDFVYNFHRERTHREKCLFTSPFYI